jgi:hypothetical protein
MPPDMPSRRALRNRQGFTNRIRALARHPAAKVVALSALIRHRGYSYYTDGAVVLQGILCYSRYSAKRLALTRGSYEHYANAALIAANS